MRDLQAIGQAAYDAIKCMVAATEVDYDRLEELRSAMDEYRSALEDADLNDHVYRDNYISDDDFAELEELEADADGNDCWDDAVQVICEDPLSVLVRDDWHIPDGDADCTEYELLLGTGGPAIRIRGTLDTYGQPDSATLQVQDWFKPWTNFEGGDESVLLRYASYFYFGHHC